MAAVVVESVSADAAEVAADEVPQVGAEVRVESAHGPFSGRYLGAMSGKVLLVTELGMVVVVPFVSRTVVCEPATVDPAVALMAQALAREAVQRRQDNDKHATWVTRLVDMAHTEANDRGWCSEFDDLMDELGLPRRSREYEVRARFSGEVSITVTATSEDEATQIVDAGDVRAALAGQGWDAFEPDVDDVEVV